MRSRGHDSYWFILQSSMAKICEQIGHLAFVILTLNKMRNEKYWLFIPRMRYGFFFKLTWVMKLSWSRACLCLMLTTGPEMREFCFLLLQALVKKNSCVYLSLCVIIHIQAYGDHTAAVSRINLFVQETPYSWPFYCTQHSFAAAGFYQTWSFVEFGRLFWSACWRTVQLIL